MVDKLYDLNYQLALLEDIANDLDRLANEVENARFKEWEVKIRTASTRLRGTAARLDSRQRALARRRVG